MQRYECDTRVPYDRDKAVAANTLLNTAAHARHRVGAGGGATGYRAVDSTSETIESMLSPKRDLIAAKLFLRLALGRRALATSHQCGRPSGVLQCDHRTEAIQRTESMLSLSDIAFI
jgi:hypothetical protein